MNEIHYKNIQQVLEFDYFNKAYSACIEGTQLVKNTLQLQEVNLVNVFFSRNPTHSQSLSEVPTWIPVTNSTARPYMNIDTTMEMKTDVYHERIAFWDLIWQHYWRKSSILVDRN